MSKYPAQIDDSTSIPIAVNNSTPVTASLFNNLRNAVIAIETTVGVSPGGVYSNLKSRLEDMEQQLSNVEVISLNNDLGGTLSDPKVIGIQGNPVSSGSPAFGDVLTWNGISWSPTSGSSSFIASNDLSGTSTSQTVVGVQGNPISNSTPNTYDTFMWDGYEWSLTQTSPILVITPTGVAATDTATIQSALDEMSGVGEVRLNAGTFGISSPILIPSNTILTMDPATVLLSSIASTGSPIDSPIRLANPVADGSSALLTSSTVLGTRTLVVDTAIAIGKVIIFGDGAANTLQQATVVNTSGAGPYTLTIDEPIRFVFVAGKSVIPYTLPTNIVIHGNGALLTGTGTNGIEFPKARKVLVDRMRVAGSFTNIAASWDLGGRDVEFRDLEVDATGAIVAISIESCVRASLTRCRTRGQTDMTGEGIWCTSAHSGVLRDCTAVSHTVHGLLISGGDLDMIIDGGEYTGNASSGILLNSCTGVTIRNASIHHNGAGITANAGTIATIDSCRFIGAGPAGTWNQNYAIRAQGAATLLQISNISTAFHSIDGIEVYTGATVTINGWNSVSERYGALSMGLGKCIASNVTWAKSTTSGWYGAYTGDGGSSDLTVYGALIDVGGTACLGFSINRAGDILRVSDTVTTGTGNTGIKVNGNVACTIWRGANVDLSSCSTQVSYGSSATQHLTTQS